MHLYGQFTCFLLAGAAQRVAARTITIEGGDDYFKPTSVNASVGDVLEFHFLPHNHSVVMGDFTTPCLPASSGGFYSGFLPASSGENVRWPPFKIPSHSSPIDMPNSQPQVFRVTINDTNPLVYYCSQNASNHNHCKSGMVGFVNQPDQTLMDTYVATAQKGSLNVSPDGAAFGGVFAANANANSSSTGGANATVTTGTPTPTSTTGSGGAKTTTTTASSAVPQDNLGVGVVGSWILGGLMALLAV